MFYTRILLALCACFFIPNLYAQSIADTTIYIMAEQMPQYPGGNDSLLKEIAARVDYPVQCSDSNIQGKVYLRFVVNTDGTIADLQAIKSPHPLLSAAAMDATRGLKKFTPGMQMGKPVRVWYSVPVSFKVRALDNIVATDSIFTQVDEPASYSGGKGVLLDDISKEMVYPDEEFKNDIHGQVVIGLVIDKDGQIESTVVEKSISPGLDTEALRICKRLKSFKPAIKNGKSVKSFYTLPIDFNLHHAETTLNFGNDVWVFHSTFATTSGRTDNHGKFLFYYYKDGYDAFMSLVNRNLIYPESAIKNKTEAIIRVNCRINDNLKLQPVKSLNDPDNIFTKEAFRLIELAIPFNEELRTSTFLKDTLPVSITFVLDKRHQWGQSAETDESRADNFFDEGVIVFNKGKYLNSLDYFNSAIKTYSLHSKSYFNRGVALLKLNDTKGACEDFRAAYLLGDLDAMEAIKQTCK